MKRLGSALVALGIGTLLGCSGAGEDSLSQTTKYEVGHKCANRDLTVEEALVEEQKDLQIPDRDEAKAPGSVTIETWVHVINKGAGAANGDVAEKMINDQINILNTAFAGNDGKTGAGFNTAYRFKLAGITRTTNAAWYNVEPDTAAEAAMKSALRKGDAKTLNIYVADLGGGLLGWATFPQWYAEDKAMDGVVILNESMPGGTAEPYALGDSATHEIGHWLGLYHTFQGGCKAPGDLVKDTPRVAEPNFGNPAKQSLDTCATIESEGGPSVIRKDLVENFMDYTDDICMDSFTLKQAIRMDRYWDKYRAK